VRCTIAKLSESQLDPIFTQLKSDLTTTQVENLTGKQLVFKFSGEINNSPLKGSGNTAIALKTHTHLMVAQLFISLLDAVDSKPGDGEIEISENFTTSKMNFWFVKLTLKGDVALVVSIEDV